MQKSLNDITDQEKEEISKLAGLFFTPREIAIMLEFDIDDFIFHCETETSPVYKSFHGGRLQREVDLRTKILKLADSGSSPAQTMAMDIQVKSKIKMLDR